MTEADCDLKSTSAASSQSFNVSYGEKHVPCEQHGEGDATLVFTHGAGGGITSAAVADFAAGFATESPIVCFDGNMNLRSRVKMFGAVWEHAKRQVALGGRSMGARAAVLTAVESDDPPDALVLVSYPLTAGQEGKREPERREQILLDLPTSTDVLFVIGDHDVQCDLEQLEKLRESMKAQSWLVVVTGADHGMSLKLASATKSMRHETGSIAGKWLRSRDAHKKHQSISWNHDEGQVVSTGWTSNPNDGDAQDGGTPSVEQPMCHRAAKKRTHG